jgi:hypothetical protein
MAIVQMAYQPKARLLWDELFTPDGDEIYLKDTRLYVPCGEKVSFRTLYRLARMRGEMLLGYLHPAPFRSCSGCAITAHFAASANTRKSHTVTQGIATQFGSITAAQA